jgi:hypothetical protein
MAKQTLFPRSISRIAPALLIGLAAVGCGTASAAPQPVFGFPTFAAAPLEGSPEQTAIDLGRGTLGNAPYRVAPIEGSPEQTAIDLGRGTQRSAPTVDEINRRIAVCNGDGDLADFNDFRDYCTGALN